MTKTGQLGSKRGESRPGKKVRQFIIDRIGWRMCRVARGGDDTGRVI